VLHAVKEEGHRGAISRGVQGGGGKPAGSEDQRSDAAAVDLDQSERRVVVC
jgi:hypothetical protein